MIYSIEKTTRSVFTRSGFCISILIIGAFVLVSCEGETGINGEVRKKLNPVVLVGAGDIASCKSNGDELTADLLETIQGTVFTTGDNVYPSGTIERFKNCYDQSWGQFKARTRPSPGNHEYRAEGAKGYFKYFGDNAGPGNRGYYSYDLGNWHIVSLNSNIDAGPGSAQLQWLRADLAADKSKCTLAYWHHPPYSSGPSGNNTQTRALFKALYRAGAEVVVAGHDHIYERFAPQDPYGRANSRGIRVFVVGTGGGELHGRILEIKSNSIVRNATIWGVLKFTLRAKSYSWEFIPVAGETFIRYRQCRMHYRYSPPSAGARALVCVVSCFGLAAPRGSTLPTAAQPMFRI